MLYRSKLELTDNLSAPGGKLIRALLLNGMNHDAHTVHRATERVKN